MSSNSQLLANRANSQLSTLAKLQHDRKQLQSRRMQQASALYEDARKAANPSIQPNLASNFQLPKSSSTSPPSISA